MEKWDVVIVIASLVALFIGVVTPIIRLNTTITKLNTTMDIFAKNYEKTDETLCEHGKTLSDHTTRITVLENKPTRTKRTA